MMLTNSELDQKFAELKTPESGRQLIRQIRTDGPVRTLQGRMDTVRTRYISKKMERALYAESRTVELPAIVFREYDKTTLELWPQPCKIDLLLRGTTGATTRLQHTPDLFLITNEGFEVEEWREERRLQRLAEERPHHFHKDQSGIWHYTPAEDHFRKLGITYRLRSADEHPRIFLANLWFLEDFNREDTPVVIESEQQRLIDLFQDRPCLPHLELVHKHQFKADHLFQMILSGKVFVDLWSQRLDLTDDLLIFRDIVAASADALLRNSPSLPLPSSAFVLREGAMFLYQRRAFRVVLVGSTEVLCRADDDPSGRAIPIPLVDVQTLFAQQQLKVESQEQPTEEYNLDWVLCEQSRLAVAMDRHAAVNANSAPGKSLRTLQRWSAKVAGLGSMQERLYALMPQQGGNRTCRLPAEVIALAEKAVKEHHNKPNNPKISATYSIFVDLCEATGLQPMSQSSFYEWIKPKQNVRAREGRRMAYQKASIPLTFDYEQPVHGVMPHEVVYIDHTILNIFLKGRVLSDLGKPTLSIAVDGALSMTRAFYLSFHAPSTASVLMLLRDYVLRNNRLPKMIVLDNGKEFHSKTLKIFCSHFGIHIRWRRRSRPRDSSMVERALGATEQELISSLDGNTLCLKDPRMISSSVHPAKFIEWTLPALYATIDHYLWNVHANRVHPRFGVPPKKQEQRLIIELGAREHIIVRYDNLFKLLTAPHSGSPTRRIDPQRGVYVDGCFYWNEKLAKAEKGECAEVRVEMWCARAVYVCFRDQWIVAQARDGGQLKGRFRHEVEIQLREERRRRRSVAQDDRKSAKIVKERVALWTPERWDDRLREQEVETYYIYEKLGMTEVMSEAKNADPKTLERSHLNTLPAARLIAVQNEPDIDGIDEHDSDAMPKSNSPEKKNDINSTDQRQEVLPSNSDEDSGSSRYRF